MLTRLSFLFIILIVAGFIATLVLFKGNWRKIQERELDKKIAMWFPFALLFLTIFYFGYFAKIIFLSSLLVASLQEFYKREVFSRKKIIVVAYAIFFIISILHIPLYNHFIKNGSVIIMIIFISTVLADVFAFFLGVFSKYKLPQIINNNKSYMGVLGQIIGSAFGVFILEKYITGAVVTHPIALTISIAVGAICGDLWNSVSKRSLSIKDWSKAIPGHGGIVDRFCSVCFAVLFSFYVLLIFSQ